MIDKLQMDWKFCLQRPVGQQVTFPKFKPWPVLHSVKNSCSVNLLCLK